jgi:diamine N-acetyltransferase
MKTVGLEALNADNWLAVCDLSVSDEQKAFFNIPNVYWIGISRYEEKSELFAIKADGEYVGLIGGGFDEDGITGYINPLMIDRHHQGNGYAKQAIRLMIEYLRSQLHVTKINLGHRKINIAANQMYDSLGFQIIEDRGDEYYRQLDLRP